MAVTKLIPTKMNVYNLGVITPTPVTVGAEGMEIEFKGKDFKTLIFVQTADVTIKAGNSIQGGGDLIVKKGTNIVLESGLFKNVSGEHKDSVFLTGAAAQVWAIELP